jgi:hypothetical protein
MGRAMDAFADVHVSLLLDNATQIFRRPRYELAERDGWVETQKRPRKEETQTWLWKGDRPHMLDHIYCDESLAKRLVGSRSLADTLIVDFDLAAVTEPVAEVVA